MRNTEVLVKLDSLLGDGKQLIVLKGLMQNPGIRFTQEENKKYYEFDLKVLTTKGTDEYNTSYNRYHIIVPVEVAKQFTDDEIKSMKNNEIIVLVDSSCSVRNISKDREKPVFKNDLTLYVTDMQLIRHVEKAIENKKVINL